MRMSYIKYCHASTSVVKMSCKVVRTGYTCQELASKLLNLVGWERTERIVLEPVVDRLSQQIKYHANMVPVIKDFIQVETFAIELQEGKKKGMSE